MNISIWYHTRLFGGEPPIDPDYSITLMTEQMGTFNASGLSGAAKEFVVCVNGDAENQAAARSIAPRSARFIDHGPEAKGLLRTVNELRHWCIEHPDWIVCFWHIKGVTHPWDRLNTYWRQCMERSIIKNWRRCVSDLEAGYDSVGAHWLTAQQYPGIVRLPFWGGQFFWAKAAFLAQLPRLPDNPKCREDWFLSENWIGMGRLPKVKDYAPHWPSLHDCGANAA